MTCECRVCEIQTLNVAYTYKLQTSRAAQKWFNSGSEARHGSKAGGGSLDRHGTEAGGAAASEIVEATRSIVTSMAGYHGRLVAQAIATAYR